MTKDIKKEIQEFLGNKLVEKTAELSRFYFIEFSGNEEMKKTVEAVHFMESLMTGKGFTKKDDTFLEKHKTLFVEIHAYVKATKDIEAIICE